MSDRTESTMEPCPTSAWCVYMVRCADNTLYTGVTTNLVRRLAEHNGEVAGGARYTRNRRPVSLVFSEVATNRSEACRKEHAIKGLTRKNKELLCNRKTHSSC